MPENKLDIQKVFEAIAYIIGKREHMDITVTAIRKKDEPTEETA